MCKRALRHCEENGRFYFSISITMPVKFFPLLLTFPLNKNIIEVKKTEMGSTTKKIKNPEWRTNARLCFFSLTGGLIKFFYYWSLRPPLRISAIGIGFP
jgi:hypothetical protein